MLSRARYLNQSTVQLSAAPAKGRVTILIASAAGAAALALEALSVGASKGFERLHQENADWWRNFWSRGMVYLPSDSGQADFVETTYTYFLYLMDPARAATSRRASAACCGSPTAT